MKNLIITSLFFILTVHLCAQNNLNTISTELKIAGISKIWSEANFNFAYFDRLNINWDAEYLNYLEKAINSKSDMEYYLVLHEFGALLKDGHSGIYYFPQYISNLIYKKKHWFDFIHANDGYFITAVDSSICSNISLNSRIIEINDTPIDEYLKVYYFPILNTNFLHTQKHICHNYYAFVNDTIESITFETPNSKIDTYTFNDKIEYADKIAT